VSFPALAADYEHATVTSGALIRVAPSADAPANGSIPTGTKLAVEICFKEGEYCLVSGPTVPPGAFIAGDLITEDGQGGMTIRASEQAKWKGYREADAARGTMPGEAKNVVVWGDSLVLFLDDDLDKALLGRQSSAQGVAGQDGKQISARMLADTSFTKRIQVIWDRHWTKESVDQYMRELAPMVERAKSLNVPFIVVSDIARLISEGDTTAAQDAADVEAMNAALKKAYPENYLDVTGVLAAPSTRIKDGLHLSGEAGEPAVAKAIAGFIAEKGW